MKNTYYILLLLIISISGFAQINNETERLPIDGGDCINYYIDEDRDGWGGTDIECLPIGVHDGYSKKTGDCDDTDPLIFPRIWFIDNDHDGFGLTKTAFTCYAPVNGVTTGGDCNDSEPAIFPKNWYYDNDHDGFGATFAGFLCVAPSNGVNINGDCDDTDPLVHQVSTWYEDADNDGFGDAYSSIVSCTKPEGFVSNRLDICPRDFSDSSFGNGCPRFSNENYVYTRKYNTAVTNSSQINSRKDVTESITYIDGLGRSKQNVAIGQGSENKVETNQFDWKNTWSIGSGSAGIFNQNGNVSENNRLLGLNPFGQTDVLWKCGSDTASDADGGWNTNSIAIDKNKAYRYTVWVKRTGSLSGYAHHGTSGVVKLNGTPDYNPYFWANSLPELDQWYLIVGYIHPASYSGNGLNESGLYDTEGNKIQNGEEFKWDSATSSAYFRNYMYYATDINAVQYFYAPTLQIIDGSETSIKGFLRNYDVPDVVTHFEYDNFGRQSKQFLPFSSKNTLDGEIYTNASNDILNYYNNQKYDYTSNPYLEKKFESSSLDRVFEIGHPGDVWKINNSGISDNTNKIDYLFNTTLDKVKLYKVDLSIPNFPTLVDSGYYNSNELIKLIVKNENWKSTQSDLNDNTVIEYKDKFGQIILKRNINLGKWHDTYNVYDDFGNLTFVLTPQVNTYPSEQNIWADQSFYIEELDTFYNNTSTYQGYNECQVNLNSNNLYVWFDNYGNGLTGSLNTTTPVIDLNFNPPLPDMQLGPVAIKLSNGDMDNTHYNAYIQNGDIYLSGDGAISYGHVYIEIDKDLTTIPITVPPVNSTMLDQFAFQYKYDSKDRLIEKKLPGKDVEFVVYDKLDRPILTQDGNLRNSKKWLFVKYDAFDRIIYSGIWTNPNSVDTRSAVQQSIDNQAVTSWSEAKTSTMQNIGTPVTPIYYTNNLIPNVGIEILKIGYYDDYNFDLAGLNVETSFGINPTSSVKSLGTGTKTKILETNNWITKVTYYDDKARPIYNASNNEYLNIVDKVKMKLDFVGKILETESTQTKGIFNAIVKDKFTYDHAGRLLTQKQQIDSQDEQLIFKNTYNDLGKIISKNIGGKTVQVGEKGLQKVDYDYNIRGWLKSMNNVARLENDLFAINYYRENENNSPYNWTGAPGSKLYNGNISATSWKTDNISSSLKSYYYNYDNLDRFTSSIFAENSIPNGKFNENISKYDRNGNILLLNRSSQHPVFPSLTIGIDNLQYKYDGNQLLSVTDAYGYTTTGVKGFRDYNTYSDDYDYDNNGNLKFDKNKIITSITYNHLNLPTKIVFENKDVSTATPKVIMFKYDADGNKIEKKVYQPTGSPAVNTIVTTNYNGDAVYKNGNLEFFSQSEGYVSYNPLATTDKYTYVFQYKDNVGNIRLAYKDVNGDGIITGASTEVFYDGFESSIGWDSSGASYGTTVSAYDNIKKNSGNVSGKIEKLTTGEQYVHSNTWVNINNTAPTEYIFSGWVYSNGPSADIYLFEKTASETNYYTKIENTTTNIINRWVYIEKKVTVPANISLLNLRIDNNGGGTVWFDDVSIRRVNPTNEIVVENNFYPFGLKHEGYNNVVSGFGNSLAGLYQYQEQERNEELGLMWDSFKWRNYDPAMARFMVIDPLAEKYEYNSTYAFQENKMGLGRELEGLELYNSDGSPNQKNIGNFANGMKNIGFGLVGAFATGFAIAETGGLGAFALGTAFMLSVDEIGIGIGQVANSLAQNSDDEDLHDSGSLLGLAARKNGWSNPGLWDGIGAVLPGVMTGGVSAIAKGGGLKTIASEVTGFQGFIDLFQSRNLGQWMFNLAGIADTIDDTNAFVDGLEEAAENNSASRGSESKSNQNQAVSVSSLTTQPIAPPTPVTVQAGSLPSFAKTPPTPSHVNHPRGHGNSSKSTPAKDSSFVKFSIPAIDFGDDPYE